MLWQPPYGSRMEKKQKRNVALAIVALVVVAGGLGIWWFLRDDAPEQANLEDAVAEVESNTTTTAADGSTGTTTDGIEGAWTIDTETGEFDYESATGSFVGFRIEEELSSIGSTTAVGRTGDLTGSMTIEGTTVTEASVDIDLSTITTNESRRDDKVSEALETGEFPTGTFTLTEPIELGAGAADGDAVEVTATGDLTIHGVTNEVTFDLEAQLVNGTVVAVGSTEITFSDFDVEVPSSPIVLSVDDHGILELKLLFVRS